MRAVILGAGNLGSRVAARWDGDVVAVTATPARHGALVALGARPTTEWPALQPGDHLVIAIPGSAAQADAIDRLARGVCPARVVLVGTVGFHAPYAGVITPSSPPGSSPRAMAAGSAEAKLRAWAPDAVVVRCGGLWCEGRGPAAAFARTGAAPLGPPDAPLPLIAYDEAASLVLRALGEARPPAVVLGVTEQPTREQYYRELASSLGVTPPAFDAPTGGMARFEDPVAARWLAEAQ